MNDAIDATDIAPDCGHGETVGGVHPSLLLPGPHRDAGVVQAGAEGS